MTVEKLNVLIVDDEKRAALNLKAMLQEFVCPDVVVSGIATNTTEADILIATHNPDAVFLDVEMPNENAFLFLNRISPINFDIVFVTAFDHYAVRAFKLNAVDYILKPISVLELRNAVIKLKERHHYKKTKMPAMTSFADLLGQPNGISQHSKITLKGTNTIETIEFDNIYFVEAQSSYSRFVYWKENTVREITMSYPLSDYEDLLPTNIFFRIHRSYLINCKQIHDVSARDGTVVVLNGGFNLPVSRRRVLDLRKFLHSNKFR